MWLFPPPAWIVLLAVAIGLAGTAVEVLFL